MTFPSEAVGEYTFELLGTEYVPGPEVVSPLLSTTPVDTVQHLIDRLEPTEVGVQDYLLPASNIYTEYSLGVDVKKPYTLSSSGENFEFNLVLIQSTNGKPSVAEIISKYRYEKDDQHPDGRVGSNVTETNVQKKAEATQFADMLLREYLKGLITS